MKLILISYHKNLNTIYPKHWIDTFRDSILNQTYKDFEIFEHNYGGGDERIFENSRYESKVMPSFIHTMNHLINKAIYYGADAVANSNCDDFLHCDWLKVQMPYIERGFDLVSCNFSLIKNDNIFHEHHFENLSIKEELEKGHNIVAHPAVIYSKNFLENNRYEPKEFPVEDMLLWKRTVDRFRFKIVPENLLYHRIHSNSVCQSNNR